MSSHARLRSFYAVTTLSLSLVAACDDPPRRDRLILDEDSHYTEVREVELLARPGGYTLLAARNEVILHLRADVTPDELDALAEEVETAGGSLVGGLAASRALQVRLTDGHDEQAFGDRLRTLKSVLAAGPNFAVSSQGANQAGHARSRQAHPATRKDHAPDTTPEEPFPGGYWIDQIHANEAWAITRGDATDGARIGVVDTGLGDGSRLVASDRLDRIDVTDFAIHDVPAGDHGRVVLGFAAGYHEETDYHVRGIAQRNSVVAVEITNDRPRCLVDALGVELFCRDLLLLSDVQTGIEKAIEEGAQVINLSIGPALECDDDESARALQHQVWREAISGTLDAARAADRLVVFSAGNDCLKTDDDRLPAGSKIAHQVWETHALVVGATDESRRDASFSTMGDVVDLTAPGADVAFGEGTGIWADLTDFFGLAERYSGTSFAAPIATGAAALVESQNPTLAAPEVKQILLDAAAPIADEGERKLLHLGAAVKTAGRTAEVPLTETDPTSLPLAHEVVHTVEVTVPATAVRQMDVLFLVDVSGSYEDDIATFTQRTSEIVSQVRARGIDVAFGVAAFSDFPQEPYGNPDAGDEAYRLVLPVTGDESALQAAIDGLDEPLHEGGDEPEAQLDALYQIATAEGLDADADGRFDGPGEIAPSPVGWRTGSLRVVVLATDVPFHDDAKEPAWSGPAFEETTSALDAAGITVIGLDSGDTQGDLHRLVGATHGEVFNLSADSAEVATALATAFDHALAAVDVSVQIVSGAEWVASVNPPVHANVVPGERRAFEVRLTGIRQCGALPQRGDVYLWIVGDASALLQRTHVPVEVPTASDCD